MYVEDSALPTVLFQSKQDAMDYITWTYFFRRLMRNPTYYGLEGVDETNLNKFLSDTVERALGELYDSGCLDFEGDEEDEREGSISANGDAVFATTLGRIASYYYLSHLVRKPSPDAKFLQRLHAF